MSKKHEIEIYYLSCLLPSGLTESGKIKVKTFCGKTKSYVSYANGTEKAQIHRKTNIEIIEAKNLILEIQWNIFQ